MKEPYRKEDSMKRTLRKISIVLLVIMFACAVTGCELLQVVAAVGEVAGDVSRGISEVKTAKSLYNKSMQNDEKDTF
jgi:Cys-tRNA synthase (O-phospho-L-seryl-tRNA:Cys-tRNA synthase)